MPLTLSASSDTVFKVECSVTARRIRSISIVVENKHFILQHYVNDNVKDETRKIKINTKSKHKISKLSMWDFTEKWRSNLRSQRDDWAAGWKDY